MAFRDDREALRARADALEAELREAQEELARLHAEDEEEEEDEETRIQRELLRQEREQRMRATRRRAGVLAMLAIGVIAFIAMTFSSWQPRRAMPYEPPAPQPLGDIDEGPSSESLEAIVRRIGAAGAFDLSGATLVREGTVVESTDPRATIGDPCRVSMRHRNALLVACGGLVLYETHDPTAIVCMSDTDPPPRCTVSADATDNTSVDAAFAQGLVQITRSNGQIDIELSPSE